MGKIEFKWIKSKNVKGSKGRFKPDMLGLGITFFSIFNKDDNFDIYIFLFCRVINIRWNADKKSY